MEVIIHIGQHKTGTSTIQHFLGSNYKQLLLQGIKYPSNHNHQMQFAKSVQLKSNVKKNLSRIRREIEPSTERLLLSSEAYSGCGPASIRMLKNVLGRNNDFKIIVYLRRQDLSLESRYIQVLKSGFVYDNINAYLRLQSVNSQLNYYGFCEKWAHVFGKENIKIGILEKTQTPDLIQDFLSLVGADQSMDLYELTRNKNVKPNINEIRAYRALYKKKVFNSPFRCMNFVRSMKLEGEKNFKLLPYSRALSVNKRFEKSNEMLAKEYLNRDDGKLFYEVPQSYEHIDV